MIVLEWRVGFSRSAWIPPDHENDDDDEDDSKLQPAEQRLVSEDAPQSSSSSSFVLGRSLDGRSERSRAALLPVTSIGADPPRITRTTTTTRTIRNAANGTKVERGCFLILLVVVLRPRPFSGWQQRKMPRTASPRHGLCGLCNGLGTRRRWKRSHKGVGVVGSL